MSRRGHCSKLIRGSGRFQIPIVQHSGTQGRKIACVLAASTLRFELSNGASASSARFKIKERAFMAEKIGFVGVGRMGANMARRLKESGYEISAVYDVNRGAAQALAQELGTQAPEELKQITKASDVIITVVT